MGGLGRLKWKAWRTVGGSEGVYGGRLCVLGPTGSSGGAMCVTCRSEVSAADAALGRGFWRKVADWQALPVPSH